MNLISVEPSELDRNLELAGVTPSISDLCSIFRVLTVLGWCSGPFRVGSADVVYEHGATGVYEFRPA